MSIDTASRTTWEIDPKHSLVELSVKHMMFTTVKGRFGDVKGTIVIDDSNPANSSVEAEIAAASIDTREEQRDAHLRSADFLDAETYPTITFKSRRVEGARGSDSLKVTGDLTMRGVTRDVVLDTTLNGRGKNPQGQDVAGFTAETTINRKDFGLNWNAALESGGLLVSDAVKILIEVQASAKR